MKHNEKWTLGRNLGGRDLKGREALGSGEFKVMKDLDSRWDKMCASSFIFDESAEAEFKKRVADKLQDIANKLGIKLFLSGRDYPIHATIHYGSSDVLDTDERSALYKEVYADNGFAKSAQSVPGQKIEFKYLRIHNGILTLDATELSPELLSMRKEFDRAAKERSVKPIARDNVMHISVAQLTDVPEENKEEIFKRMKQALIELRHEISSNPIQMKIEGIFNGSDIMYRDRKDL